MARSDDDLRRPAADVDNGHEAARRRVGQRDCADEGEPALLDGGQDARRESGCGLEPGQQLAAVLGLAAGARDQHLELGDAGRTGVGGVAGDDLGRELELLGEIRPSCSTSAPSRSSSRSERTGCPRTSTSRRTVFDPTSTTPTGIASWWRRHMTADLR